MMKKAANWPDVAMLIRKWRQGQTSLAFPSIFLHKRRQLLVRTLVLCLPLCALAAQSPNVSSVALSALLGRDIGSVQAIPIWTALRIRDSGFSERGRQL